MHLDLISYQPMSDTRAPASLLDDAGPALVNNPLAAGTPSDSPPRHHPVVDHHSPYEEPLPRTYIHGLQHGGLINNDNDARDNPAYESGEDDSTTPPRPPKARKPPKPPPTTAEYARALGKSPSAGSYTVLTIVHF